MRKEKKKGGKRCKGKRMEKVRKMKNKRVRRRGRKKI